MQYLGRLGLGVIAYEVCQQWRLKSKENEINSINNQIKLKEIRLDFSKTAEDKQQITNASDIHVGANEWGTVDQARKSLSEKSLKYQDSQKFSLVHLIRNLDLDGNCEI